MGKRKAWFKMIKNSDSQPKHNLFPCRAKVRKTSRPESTALRLLPLLLWRSGSVSTGTLWLAGCVLLPIRRPLQNAKWQPLVNDRPSQGLAIHFLTETS